MIARLLNLRGIVTLAAALTSLFICDGNGLANADTVGLPPVHAAFLGDSYTFGVGATVRTDGYAYLVARAEHWTADVVGLPGSGYVRIAHVDDKTIAAGIAPVIAAQPGVVIVECGRNDVDQGIKLSQVQPRALRDLRALRAGLPNATIVVLGPIWLSGHPGARVFAVRNAVHAAQRQIPNSRWIDPVAQRWFTGRLADRTGDDASMINYAVSHPNDLGYRHIARRLESDLRSLGLS
ncbi:MAG TPA: SGNH/GDSL hydrolase family protein [Solirubrobacteraceae bacterium]|nr:SGNH/GDSL hydrolase family protein [Solirubrobacteraceae bacterium]